MNLIEAQGELIDEMADLKNQTMDLFFAMNDLRHQQSQVLTRMRDVKVKHYEI